MKKSDSLLYYISLSYLFCSVYVIANFPYSDLVLPYISFIQFFIFLCFVVVQLNLNNIFMYKPKFNYLNFLSVLLFLIFFVSVFIANGKVNFDAESIFKFLTYITCIYIFFVHFSRIIFSDDEKFYNFLKVIVYFAVADAIFAIFSKFTGFRYSNQ